jgi:nitrate/TMAO reductase-like tetraheme cytochrome c subunit
MTASSLFALSFIILWFRISSNFNEYTHPLIIVNGKKAPRLTPLTFHIETNSDSDCMSCHQINKNFTLKETKYQSKKVPHEYRENCTSCHILEL